MSRYPSRISGNHDDSRPDMKKEIVHSSNVTGCGAPSSVRTLTVVVPALNEGNNIGFLLGDILSQELGDSLLLEEVKVVSDASTDDTNSIVRTWCARDERVHLVVNPERLGKAQSINVAKRDISSDFLVLLDGDIRLNGHDTMRKLLENIGPGVGLIGGNPVPSRGNRNLGAAVSERADYLRNHIMRAIRSGANLYSAHGRIMALTREFYATVEIPMNPKSEKLLVETDIFLYLTCIKKGFDFVLRDEAEALFKLPDSMRDHIKQGIRFRYSISSTQAFFANGFVEREYHIPIKTKLGAVADSFYRKPLATLLWIVVYIYADIELTVRKLVLRQGVNAAWEICRTTKDGISDEPLD